MKKVYLQVLFVLCFALSSGAETVADDLTVSGNLVVTNGDVYVFSSNSQSYVYSSAKNDHPWIVLTSSISNTTGNTGLIDFFSAGDPNEQTRRFSVFHGSPWGSGLRVGDSSTNGSHLAYSTLDPYPGWYVDKGFAVYGADYSSTNSSRFLNTYFRLPPRFSAPENPEEGTVYIDGSGGNRLKVWDGSAWQIMRTQQDLDSRYVRQSGGTVSGLLTLGNLIVGSGTASGIYSVAQGYGNRADGLTSHAEGWGTSATGNSSHAEGQSTQALGARSHAEGAGSKAVGYNSHAEGQNTTASGANSHAEGEATKAHGDASHAEGKWTLAEGYVSHAEGYETEASGSFSHAEGLRGKATGLASHAAGAYASATNDYTYVWSDGAWIGSTTTQQFTVHAENGIRLLGGPISGDGSGLTNLQASSLSGTMTGGLTIQSNLVVGIGTAPGQYAFAQGMNVTASGIFSHAEGHGTTASGWAAHAEGASTTATGDYSHAEGYLTTASGFHSHAEGYYTTASGENSHAEGIGSRAWGDYSHAEGGGTIADGRCSHAEGGLGRAGGDHSHAEGYDTHAGGEASHAAGAYARATNDHTYVWSDGTETGSTTTKQYTVYAENGIRLLGGPISGDGSGLTNLPSIGFDGLYVNKTGDTITGGLTIQSNLVVGIGTAPGRYAFAQGMNVTASGIFSHAEGAVTVASGGLSHAEGLSTTASGAVGHAEGDNTTASGYASHAQGTGTLASGEQSHAEGLITRAEGHQCHAEGLQTIAGGKASHAAGAYAHATNDHTYVWSDGTTIGSTTTKQYTVYAQNGIRLLGGPISGDGSGLTNLNVVTPETDPMFTNSPVYGITAEDIANWNSGESTNALLLNGSRPMQADLDMGGHSITNISTNSLVYDDGQSVRQTYVDTAGDTMSGPLTVQTNLYVHSQAVVGDVVFVEQVLSNASPFSLYVGGDVDVYGTYHGDGSGLTGLNATNLLGVISTNRLPPEALHSGGGTASNATWGYISGLLANQSDLTAALNGKADSSLLAVVATTGNYNDLNNAPTLASIATSPVFSNLIVNAGEIEQSKVNGLSGDLADKLDAVWTNNLGTMAYAETNDYLSANAVSGFVEKAAATNVLSGALIAESALAVQGAFVASYIPPQGDLLMGSYTNGLPQ